MRSLLFVPGGSAREFEKARRTAADALILDLEDSVTADRKDEAPVNAAFAPTDAEVAWATRVRDAWRATARRAS